MLDWWITFKVPHSRYFAQFRTMARQSVSSADYNYRGSDRSDKPHIVFQYTLSGVRVIFSVWMRFIGLARRRVLSVMCVTRRLVIFIRRIRLSRGSLCFSRLRVRRRLIARRDLSKNMGIFSGWRGLMFCSTSF